MGSRRKTVLLAAWGFLFVLGTLCAAIFAHGLLRDHRTGEPVIPIDLAAESGWLATSFRLYGEGDYRLILSSVNHDAGLVGRSFGGRLDVQVIGPDRGIVFERVYDRELRDYQVPSNYGDQTLDVLKLSGWPLRTWQLRVRLADGDPDFRAVRSELKLWKERYDPGMGGMINYVMIIPAGIFLALALLLSLPLARNGVRSPLAGTAGLFAAIILLLGT